MVILSERSRRHRFSKTASLLNRLRVPQLPQTRPRTRAAPLLLQQSLRRLPTLPGLRQHHRFRPEPHRSRQVPKPERRRNRPLEPPQIPQLVHRPQAPSKALSIPMDTPWQDLTADLQELLLYGDNEPAKGDRLSRNLRLLRRNGAQEIQAPCPRNAFEIQRLRHLPGVPRSAPSRRSPLRPH
jgi:hypothetical protein